MRFWQVCTIPRAGRVWARTHLAARTQRISRCSAQCPGRQDAASRSVHEPALTLNLLPESLNTQNRFDAALARLADAVEKASKQREKTLVDLYASVVEQHGCLPSLDEFHEVPRR
eukprot:474750-Rhodomonas_salina.5